MRLDEFGFPCPRVWADRASAGDLGGRLLALEHAFEITTEIACSGCLEDWLRGLGVDLSLSEEEQRFVRLRDSLASLLIPMSEEHERVTKMVKARAEGGVSWGTDGGRSRPFHRYVTIRGTETQLAISAEDEGQQLTCGVVNTLLPALTAPPEVAIELAAGELSPSAQHAVSQWGKAVLRFLKDCAPQISLLPVIGVGIFSGDA